MDYPSSKGAVFPVLQKQHPKAPDFTGNLEISNEQIRKLIEMSKAGIQPKLQISMWNNHAQSTGAAYFGLQAQVYMKEQQAPAQQQPYQPPALIQEDDDDLDF